MLFQADSSTGYPQLKLCWASKQQLEQRKGRVGRVAAGHVFRLVPKVRNFYVRTPRGRRDTP